MCLTERIHELYCVKHLGASEANMKSQYLATLRQNPGRQALSVEFRHPLRPDPSNQGKPGRKDRKGLGTDRVAAERLVAELNGLLAESYSPFTCRKGQSRGNFKDPRIIEIFYRRHRTEARKVPRYWDGPSLHSTARGWLSTHPSDRGSRCRKDYACTAANSLAPRPRSVSFDFR